MLISAESIISTNRGNPYKDFSIPEIISELNNSYNNMYQEFLAESLALKVAAGVVLVKYHKQIFKWIGQVIDLLVSFRDKVIGWFRKGNDVLSSKFGSEVRGIAADISKSKVEVIVHPNDPYPFDYKKTYKNRLKASQIKQLVQRFGGTRTADINSSQTIMTVTSSLGIPNDGNYKTVADAIKHFVNGPAIKTPIVYNRKSAKFLADVLANQSAENTEITNMFDAIIKELQNSEKELEKNKEMNQSEIDTIRDKVNILRLISSSYISARLAMNAQLQNIAFKLVGKA